MKDAKVAGKRIQRDEHRFRMKASRVPAISTYHHQAKDIMVPLSAFLSRIYEGQTAAEAMEKILSFFNDTFRSSGSKESLHQSILVVDEHEKVVGVLNFSDLLKSFHRHSLRLLPQELAPTTSASRKVSSHHSDFTLMVREKAAKKIRELLPQEFPAIDENADLTEALEKIVFLKTSSLLVLQNNEPVGVLRQKDLFLEMARIMSDQQ